MRIKTPHRITLVYQRGKSRYDPSTDSYIQSESHKKTVPALCNFITQERVGELYGDRTAKILVARFNQTQAPFQEAEFNGELFRPIEMIDAPIKGAVRLRAVEE